MFEILLKFSHHLKTRQIVTCYYVLMTFSWKKCVMKVRINELNEFV